MIYQRKWIMLDAHRRYRNSKEMGLGFSFADCLRTAWAAEKIRCTPEYQRDYVADWHGPERKRTLTPSTPPPTMVSPKRLRYKCTAEHRSDIAPTSSSSRKPRDRVPQDPTPCAARCAAAKASNARRERPAPNRGRSRASTQIAPCGLPA